MILSDGDIRDRLEGGDLTVEPVDDEAVQIQPASIDVRLGPEFKISTRDSEPAEIVLDGKTDPTEDQEFIDVIDVNRDGLLVRPGDFVLAETYERIELPNDLVATLEGRSSIGRIAVQVHVTAGHCDPGFSGTVTLEITNLGTDNIRLIPGIRIGQLVFKELKNPAERPYGNGRGSKYQDQSGPQQSRIGQDESVTR